MTGVLQLRLFIDIILLVIEFLLYIIVHLFVGNMVVEEILKKAEESNDPEQRASAHFMSLGHKILMSFGSSLTQEDNQ